VEKQLSEARLLCKLKDEQIRQLEEVNVRDEGGKPNQEAQPTLVCSSLHRRGLEYE